MGVVEVLGEVVECVTVVRVAIHATGKKAGEYAGETPRESGNTEEHGGNRESAVGVGVGKKSVQNPREPLGKSGNFMRETTADMRGKSGEEIRGQKTGGRCRNMRSNGGGEGVEGEVREKIRGQVRGNLEKNWRRKIESGKPPRKSGKSEEKSSRRNQGNPC